MIHGKSSSRARHRPGVATSRALTMQRYELPLHTMYDMRQKKMIRDLSPPCPALSPTSPSLSCTTQNNQLSIFVLDAPPFSFCPMPRTSL